MKRAKTGWHVECRRGRWYAVDRATHRRIRCRDKHRAEQVAAEKTVRDLTGVARFPLTLLWGA